MENPIRLVVSILGASVLFLTACSKQAKYRFAAKVPYTIYDQKKFENTYLFESFGYLIGDPHIPGVKFNDALALSPENDYIFALHKPVEAVYTNSYAVRNEGSVPSKKDAVEIVLNDNEIDSGYIYIYELKPKGKYRLLMP